MADWHSYEPLHLRFLGCDFVFGHEEQQGGRVSGKLRREPVCLLSSA